MLCILIWWAVDAHKWFKGPNVNIQHRIHQADDGLIDGEPRSSDGGGSGTGVLPADKIEPEHPYAKANDSSDSLKQAQDAKAAALT